LVVVATKHYIPPRRIETAERRNIGHAHANKYHITGVRLHISMQQAQHYTYIYPDSRLEDSKRQSGEA
jgi:hypothetical protein